MGRYQVIIEGAEDVWPPVPFDDFFSALKHAISLAKAWKGLQGTPRIGITGVNDFGFQEVDWYLRAELMTNYIEGRP